MVRALGKQRFGTSITMFLSAVSWDQTLPVYWRVVGVADFNGDNKPDYLLYNPSTRQTAIWYMDAHGHRRRQRSDIARRLSLIAP